MEGQNMENNQAQQQGASSNQQQNNQGERTFTQDDVNRIVQERLARYKGGNDPEGFAEREKALNQRELRLEARERLADAGLPKGLLDVVNLNNKDDMEKSINALSAYFGNNSAPGEPAQDKDEKTYREQLEQMQNEKFLTEKGVRAADIDYIMFKVGQKVDGKTDFKTAAETFLKENPRFTGPTYRVSTGSLSVNSGTQQHGDEDIRKAMGLKGQ